MSIAFLNGEFLDLNQARISPLDRGFLFGDGIYEVIPTYKGQAVGLKEHLERLESGLNAIGIPVPYSNQEWCSIIDALIEKNRALTGAENLGIYIQISRGADTKRNHAFPDGVKPTCFSYTMDIPSPPVADRTRAKGFKVALQQDKRWQLCHIKSTSLLGNVIHYQEGKASGLDETILFNEDKLITEASSSNVFMVKNGEVTTPPLDNQILPGITRRLVIRSLEKEGIAITKRHFTIEELLSADEVWLTSSSKEIAPVVEIDGNVIGNGEIGAVWENALTIFNKYKFEH